MKTPFGHLTYCTNIHPGENWTDHFAAIQQYFPSVKNALSPNQPMGIGLRLSAIASTELAVEKELDLFKSWLKKEDAYVFTMNGFPFGGFHHTVVKEQVHAPDWTTSERLDYTKRMFTILAALLPENVDGGVSTSPLSYRYWFPSDDAIGLAKEIATNHILDVAEQLIEIYQHTGKVLHLDIEPEPDGLLETGKEFIDWFHHYLLDLGIKKIATKFSVTNDEAEEMIKRHICLCYDVCHFAIGFENHAEMIGQLEAAGINIGKIQISAALKAEMPDELSKRQPIKMAFSGFNESTYLHQVIALKKDGHLIRYRDLPLALPDVENPSVKEWRAHFHVPIFNKSFGILQSTQADIEEVLSIHKKSPFTNHLEVETYTWDVLANSLKLPMGESITRELQWIRDQLSS